MFWKCQTINNQPLRFYRRYAFTVATLLPSLRFIVATLLPSLPFYRAHLPSLLYVAYKMSSPIVLPPRKKTPTRVRRGVPNRPRIFMKTPTTACAQIEVRGDGVFAGKRYFEFLEKNRPPNLISGDRLLLAGLLRRVPPKSFEKPATTISKCAKSFIRGFMKTMNLFGETENRRFVANVCIPKPRALRSNANATSVWRSFKGNRFAYPL